MEELRIQREREKHELALAHKELRLKVELEKVQPRSENHIAVVEASVAHLKLPIYQKREDITTFLTRLERIAMLLQVFLRR